MTAIRFEDVGGSVTQIQRHSGPHRMSHAIARLSTTLRGWRRRSKDRAQLAALDERTLADIGISRAEAEFLANKPFWKE